MTGWLAILFALLPSGTFAQDPMSGSDFDAFSLGKILTYVRQGELVGTEQYLPGQKVIWQGEDRSCLKGFWREAQPGLICFYYPDLPFNLECARYYPQGEGLRVEPDWGTGAAQSLTATEPASASMDCEGQVGA